MKNKFALFIICGIIMIGCGKKTSMNSNEKYKHLIGKEYETTKEMALFSFADNKNEYYIGKFDTQAVPKKDKLKGNFPCDYYGNRIYGIIPKDTTFKITDIIKEETIESTYIWYMAEIISESKFRKYKVNVSQLAKKLTVVPEFDTEYVKAISNKNK